MTPFSTFYDYLMPELSGVTTPMVDLHLRQVARDFLLTTYAWKVDFDPVDLVGGQSSYTLVSPNDQGELARVERVSIAGTLLWNRGFIQQDLAKFKLADTRPKYDAADPPFSMSVDSTLLTLIDDEKPTASLVDGLQVFGALIPAMVAVTLPDFLFTRHVEHMREGVLGRLMVMAKKPWSNPDQGVMYLSAYHAGKTRIAAEAANGFTRKPLRVRKWG